MKVSTRGGTVALEKLKRMGSQVKKVNSMSVRVGVPDGKNEAGTNIPLTLIAAAHEFGLGNLPERPFLASGLKAGRDQLRKQSYESLKKVVESKIGAGKALQLLGLKGAALVKQYIRNGNFAPLKPETIKRKGSSKPLIDTGNLVQSITSEVVDD